MSSVDTRALGSRRFRLYLIGQIVSLSGTAVQQVGLAWLMYRLSGSSALVGTTVLLTQLPILLLSPIAGVLADRFDRGIVLIATQAAGGLQALALALAAATQVLSISALLGLSLLLGIVNSVDVPARQSIVPRLVDRPQDIGNAVALSAAALHLSRLLGPAVAAVLLAHFDVWVCFLCNSVSYVATIVVLHRLDLTAHEPIRQVSLNSLREGFKYCLEHAEVKYILQLVILTSLLAIPYTVLLPAASQLWFAAEAPLYAKIMSVAGSGSLLAALFLAQFHDHAMLKFLIPSAALVSGGCLVVLGLAAGHLSSIEVLASIALLGCALTLVISGANVAIQHQLPEVLRGRVMGLFVMSFNGVGALGNLLWGTLADRYGLAGTFSCLGMLLGVGTVSLLFVEYQRR